MHKKLCRAIVNEENPVTDFDLLVDDIGRIAGSLKEHCVISIPLLKWLNESCDYNSIATDSRTVRYRTLMLVIRIIISSQNAATH